VDEFQLGDLEYWRRMPYRTFLAWQRLAMLRHMHREQRRQQQGG
jgi:hypothetical protein